MDEYFIGIIKESSKDKIIFESSNHGYKFYGVNLQKLPINKILKLYIYFFNRPGYNEYFAFIDQETKKCFIELISISNIGPKTAIKILNLLSIDDFIQAIKLQNIRVLQQCRGVTKKLASKIIEHFNYKLKIAVVNQDYQQQWNLVFDALLKLGFNKDAINKYLLNVDWKENIEKIISCAVKELHYDYY